jgi:hypothetical protein
MYRLNRIQPQSLALILLATVAGSSTAFAQKATVFAAGFKYPSKIITGPAGTLLVTDMDTTPNSGRISLLDSGGNRRTLIGGLPSGLAVPDLSPDGPSGMALVGRTLYIVNGEGDAHRNGTSPGTLLANPAGPSSPIFCTILKVDFNNDIDKITGAFALAAQDHFTLADHSTLTLSNGSGDNATIRLLAEFRVNRPDARTIYRNTHLFGIALLPSQPNSLFLADSGNNAIWQVDIGSGRSQLMTRFANTPNPLAGPPTSEAVPTNIHAYEDQLLVSLLSGAPFAPGASRIMAVDPATGNASLFIAVLTSTIDTLFRRRPDGSGQWLALEYSLDLPAGRTPPVPGRLLNFEIAPGPYNQVLIDNLTSPSAMAFDPSTGNLFITDRADGTVLVANIGK